MGLRFRFDVDIDSLNPKRFETDIVVGYPSDEEHHSGLPASNIARLLSEGTETIPPRPHLQEGIEQGMPFIKEAVRQYARGFLGIFGNKKGDPQKIADAVRNSVLDYIYSGALEPNAPSTIARKGFDEPLIEEGELVHLLEARVLKR
jgi:hypothetical protein